MKIGQKIMLPSGALLILLLVTLIYTVVQFRIEKQLLWDAANRIEAIETIGLNLSTFQNKIELQVLSYRLVQDKNTLDTIGVADLGVAKAVAALQKVVSLNKEKKLLNGFIERRSGIKKIRSVFLDAIDTGAEKNIQSAYTGWAIKVRQINASLADIEGFNARSIERTLSLIEKKRELFYTIMTTLIVVAGAIVFFSFFFYRRVIVGPINSLSDLAKIYAGGNLKAKPSGQLISLTDEIGNLGLNLTRMAEDLQRTTVSRDKLLTEIKVREQTEKDLRESEARLRRSVIDAPIPIMIHAEDGEVLMISQQWTNLSGYTHVEIPTITEWTEKAYGKEDTIEESRERIGALYNIEKNEGEGEYYITTKSGKAMIWDFRSSPLGKLPDGRSLVISMAIDITERKQVEEKVRKLSQAVEQSATQVVITDAEGNIEFVNPKFTEVTGYSAEEAIGQNPRFLKSEDTPPKKHKELWATITSGSVWRGELQNKRKDGSLYWDLTSISPIKAPDGTITHFLAIKEDITKHKALEEQLIQAQKMESIGQLTGGIAHDFNNLMGVIMGNLEMAKDDKTGEERNELISNAIRAVDRGAALTQQLLSFSRKQVLNPKFTGINELVAENLKLLERTLGEDIEIETQFSEEPLPVHIDTAMFGNALLNLSLNARDAMPDGGQMTIRTEQLKLNGEIKGEDNKPAIGPYVRVTITDTGRGMDKDQIARAVEPFYTTKEVGEGSGLGLSMVYGFMEQSGGHMTIDSEKGKGTTISLYIPVTDEMKDEDVALDAPCKPISQSKTILVVEDDLDVLNTTSRILRDMGYEVIEAADGPSAGEMLVERSDEIDLLFSDMVMPKGMNGLELAEWVKGKYDHIKVLLTSGYPDKVASKDYNKSSRVTMLAKPYKRAQLAKAIDDAFDSQ